VQRKVQAISQQLAAVLAAWPEVEAVVLGEAAESRVLDPYFAIPLDVYHRGELPSGLERRARFGSPAAFETVPAQPSLQDRFLLSELPVRVRYQEAGRFEELLERIEARQWVFHDSSPGLFYRLAQGQPLYVRSAWLEECRKRLLNLPDHYWGVLLEGSQRAFSYALTDLKASALRDDALFFAIALTQFVRALASFLFALNRRFEPGPRLLSAHLARLERLPDGFAGRFESLLREEPELDRERKCEIAGLLARSALAMV
jgi:hypothetical protein